MGMNSFSTRNTPCIWAVWLDCRRIWCSGPTLSLIVPSSSHVHQRADSLFNSIPRRASYCFGLNTFPIHSSCIPSGVNLPPLALWVNMGINHLSQGPGIGTTQVITLPLLTSPASGVLPSVMGTRSIFWATHLKQLCTQAAVVFSSKLHFAKSLYKKMGHIWLRLGAMLLLETDPKVLDSLPVTLLSFTRASSTINHSSVTILLPSSLTTSPYSSSHSSSQFTPLPTSFLMAFDSPPLLTECSPSLNVSFSFVWYNPSTFPASPHSYPPTSSLFLFCYLNPSHSHLSSQNCPTSYLHSAGPYFS